MSNIEPASYFDVPAPAEKCAECNDPCRPGVGLCEPCLRDAEEDAHADDCDRARDDYDRAYFDLTRGLL